MVNEVLKPSQINQEMPLNVEFILKELDGDKALLIKVVGRFIKKVRMQLDSIRQAIADNNPESIIFEAHAMRGGASNLRVYKLAELAGQLEKTNLTRNSSERENYRICGELEAELNSLAAYVSGIDE